MVVTHLVEATGAELAGFSTEQLASARDRLTRELADRDDQTAIPRVALAVVQLQSADLTSDVIDWLRAVSRALEARAVLMHEPIGEETPAYSQLVVAANVYRGVWAELESQRRRAAEARNASEQMRSEFLASRNDMDVALHRVQLIHDRFDSALAQSRAAV